LSDDNCSESDKSYFYTYDFRFCVIKVHLVHDFMQCINYKFNRLQVAVDEFIGGRLEGDELRNGTSFVNGKV
jgi:hypothetical protein